ncbi:capsular biosynthesis protein [Agrobacterium vitis]|uniref:Capsular biosynthesis protein n=1 Tax=Agrobacterium vitis TaxID=373 RepID=A0ABD6GED2_AGRVI|nr:capsular biosynthesis protein [Agrobacterium vitis]MUO79712.1 capsular biosynthesis protein [Agrobacterium vitis]MUO96864.1 capsular biosynthesis protein [Agrobacterium vitis]MUP07675.1 capsular biosynthesis protein [Agrobacterium vitis]MUZ83641.1 capsular biosynthesis protein [Agrobacterium vitis]MVA11868.1 capsular biosynthesis protein [Agrobacterium vitis]
MTSSEPTKAVLFLQGPPSILWTEFARAFEQAGVKTHHVNFTLGDFLFWRKRGAKNYRGSFSKWPAFLRRLIAEKGITDIVYYADRLPYHAKAAEIGAEIGVRCHAVEWGYLRPDWLTFERDGMGRFSHFPNDPKAIRAIAAKVEEPDIAVKYPHTFGQEAFNEVIYNLLNFFGRPFYPLYNADKYYSALVDYLPWLLKAGVKPARLPEGFLEDGQPPFYLVALQLQSDYQIRANSPYRHLRDMMRQVIASFVKNAPAGSKLLFKQHPLDNGLERWHKVLRHIAREFKIEDRVVFIEEGDLHDILQKTAGVVIVNSTVGLHSLRAQKPTIVLGCAVFDVPGLTHQGRLDDFWKRPEPVDPELMRDLVKALAATIQIKGDFFNKAGRQAAIGAMVQRVIEGTVNMPDAFIDPPPRLTSPKGILTVLGRPVELDWEEDAAVPDMTYARSGPTR